MKQAILGQRRAIAVEGIANQLERITGLQVDLTSGLKGNSEHRQLFMLERILDAMRGFSGDVVQLQESDGEPCYTLAEILAVEGLSKTSTKALEAALNGSSN
jgi:hypothetical protein